MLFKNKLRRSVKQALLGALDPWIEKRFEQPPSEPISTVMREACKNLRGDHPPAILIHGVLPRSGTVYVGELLRAHPNIHAYPNQIWEMPLLHATPEMQKLQQSFINGYKINADRFQTSDFLALVGSAFIGYLHAQIPSQKRLLMKTPLASHLPNFNLMFPHERCLMLMRDGRDLTASTLKSWPQQNFDHIVTRWRDSAACMLAQDHPLYRYEDIVADPHLLIRTICTTFDLDVEDYPFDSIDHQPVKGSSENIDQKGWDAVTKGDDFRPVGRWADWSKREKRKFKRIAGDILIQAGYASDHNW